MKAPTARAAFFDLDNTLINGSSLYHFFKGLVKSHEITPSCALKFAWEHFKFKQRRSESAKAIAMATDQSLSFVAGKYQRQIISIAEAMVENVITKTLFPKMVERVEEHKLMGDHTWIITAAPTELAELICEKLGMTGGVGTCSEVRDGKFTGRLPQGSMHGYRKAERVNLLAKRHGYDLDASFAYSDSANDLPMLAVVGNPHIVNPDKYLMKVANKNSWPILQAT